MRVEDKLSLYNEIRTYVANAEEYKLCKQYIPRFSDMVGRGLAAEYLKLNRTDLNNRRIAHLVLFMDFTDLKEVKNHVIQQ